MKELIIFFIVIVIILPLPKEVKLVDPERKVINVYVSGEVLSNGLVAVPYGTTMFEFKDFLKLTKQADLSIFDQTHVLKHMEAVFVPELGLNGLVSINYASKEELEQLPDIGPKLAQDIIDFRNRYGFFQSIEDLMKVPGIKAGKFETIKNMISK
jgi:competence protein ComEA